MAFAKKLAELRNNKKITYEDLAQDLGVEKDIIIKWESAETEPSISQLVALAKHFHVGTDYLLGLDGKKQQPPNPFSGLLAPYIDLNNKNEEDVDEELLNELIELTEAVDLKRSK